MNISFGTLRTSRVIKHYNDPKKYEQLIKAMENLPEGATPTRILWGIDAQYEIKGESENQETKIADWLLKKIGIKTEKIEEEVDYSELRNIGKN